MQGPADIELVLRGAILAVPFALFLTLLVLILRRRARRKSVVDAPATTARALDTGEIDDRAAVEKKIAAALATQDTAALAPLYLTLARRFGAEGNEQERLAALRSAAGCAALHGPVAAHAAARVELGDTAHAAGDLTEACEQWQLARAAFLADGQTDEHARVDKRMRDNGCPTDWVLTDF